MESVSTILMIKKLEKQLTTSSQTRMKIFLDEFSVWNMSSDLKMRKSFMVAYLYDTRRFNKHKTRARRNRKRSNTRNFFS